MQGHFLFSKEGKSCQKYSALIDIGHETGHFDTQQSETNPCILEIVLFIRSEDCWIINHIFLIRLDSGEDQRVDKEEFTSDKMKEAIEKVSWAQI